MTQNRSGMAYEFVGSGLGSPNETRHMAVDWAAGGG
jgi:hypothetical protein